jgi:hypothetical protein
MLPGRTLLLFLVAFLLCLFSLSAYAQRVSPYDSHTRIYAIVPVDGRGTKDDPFRPRYLPNPRLKRAPQSAAGVKILGWTGVLSADRTKYFIQVVVDKRSDLAPMLNDASVRWWDKGVTPAAVVDAELKKLQPAAALQRLRLRVK